MYNHHYQDKRDAEAALEELSYSLPSPPPNDVSDVFARQKEGQYRTTTTTNVKDDVNEGDKSADVLEGNRKKNNPVYVRSGGYICI